MKARKDIISWCEYLLSTHPNVEDCNYLKSIINVCQEGEMTSIKQAEGALLALHLTRATHIVKEDIHELHVNGDLDDPPEGFSDHFNRLYECAKNAVKFMIATIYSSEELTDLESRQAALEALGGWENVPLRDLDVMSSVTPKQKTGHWETKEYESDIGVYLRTQKCNRCGAEQILRSKFCPECGIKMENPDD